MLQKIKDDIKNIFYRAIACLAKRYGIFQSPDLQLRIPTIQIDWDLSSNIAMQLSKIWKIHPKVIAEELSFLIQKDQEYKEIIDDIECTSLGFINLKLKKTISQSVVKEILSKGFCFEKKPIQKEKKIIIEFISANPTGPLHIGHGRQAVLGDALSNLMINQGWNVYKEFYYNDSGTQIKNLALSIKKRMQGYSPNDIEWPKDAYNGEYIIDIAKAYSIHASKKTKNNISDEEILKDISRFAIQYLRNEQKTDLQKLNVIFDSYYLESSLYEKNILQEVIKDLWDSGYCYELDEALWLKTMNAGDDKDRVLRKSDGTYTYFALDIAYHSQKWLRGFLNAINIQGVDHYGTIARVRAGLQFLSKKRKWNIPKNYPNYILHKMVTVIHNGREVKISKRTGSYITIRDLIEWSGGYQQNMNEHEKQSAILRGRDAVRFFLVSKKPETEFIFDIDLALKQSKENPVFYIQYAYARICSVLRQWGGCAEELLNADLSLLSDKDSNRLIKRLNEYQDLLDQASKNLTPHIIPFYLRSLAHDLHIFYDSQKVLCDNTALQFSRLALVCATKQILFNGLQILGISSPEKM